MTVQITIRNVPPAVRNELASRAAHEGKSMQRYLLELLERTVAHPSMAVLILTSTRIGSLGYVSH